MAVNGRGAVAGESAMTASTTDPAFAWHATLWTNTGEPRDIGTLAGDNFSMALGLSPDGVVVGISAFMDYLSGQPGRSHAFVWTGHGPPQPLPLPVPEGLLGSSTANAIDNLGNVVGSYAPPSSKTRAVLWTCAVTQ